MPAIAYKQLTNISIELLHKTWIKAFSDYQVPVSLSVQELEYMLERRGYNASLSFGAFDGNTLIGFILNGIRKWNEKLTAYDTGTALIKEYRRQGIAAGIFDESLPILKSSNIKQYLLEVLQPNKAAYDLYHKKGFEVERKFDCYVSPVSNFKFREKKPGNEFQILELKEPDWELFRSFWAFKPSWQNSSASIEQKLPCFTMLGVETDNNIIAYGIIENHTGDIPQIAVKESYRRNGLGTAMLQKLLGFSTRDQVRIINVDAGYTPFRDFMNSVSLSPEIGQYEMTLKL